MEVDEFLLGFHSEVQEISKLYLNHELKGPLLFKKSNPDAHDLNIAVVSAGEDYPLLATTNSLLNVYRPEGPSPSFVPTSMPVAEFR